MNIGDLDRVDITEQDIDDALTRPRDFGYHGDNDEMFKTWSIGPAYRTRDSGILDKSNADVFERELAQGVKDGLFSEDDFALTGASHWGCGWVDQVSFRVIDNVEDRNPTNIFKFIKDWFDGLRENYPVADDSDYSEKQYEATVENITWEGRGLPSDKAPDDWAESVHGWLSEYEPEQVEDSDDSGGYPSEESIKRALKDRGWLDEEAA